MSFKPRELPKRPFRNFAAYLENNSTWSFGSLAREGDRRFGCPTCKGCGIVVAPWERPDPVEGYKMAVRIACKQCNGTGLLTEQAHRLLYKARIREWEEHFAKVKPIHDAEVEAFRKAKDLLTRKELKLLGLIS